jgi:hypothetical protein
VRQEVFGQARPASTLVGTTALAVPGAIVEIDLVAGVTPEWQLPFGPLNGASRPTGRQPVTW